jgi:ATP-dependent Clp protease ATP-binding subunit ClpC
VLMRFTDRARKVMALANQEAQRLNHEYIGTEHILLGLVREGGGVGFNVLKNLNVDLYKIPSEIERLVKSRPGNGAAGEFSQNPTAKKAIEFALEESRNLNTNYVGTEHLLLGLLRIPDSLAAMVLNKLGLNLEEAREEICMLLGVEFPQPMTLLLGEEGGQRAEEHHAVADEGRTDSTSFEELFTSDKAALLLQSLLAELASRKGHAVLDADYERATAYRDLMLGASHLMDQLLSILRRGQPPKGST